MACIYGLLAGLSSHLCQAVTPTALLAEGTRQVLEQQNHGRTEIIKSPYTWQTAKVQMCAENPREPRENEKLGETCKFSALLNAFLNLHTAHVAEDRNLTGLRYVNIISAQISGWQWNYTGRPKEWRVREIISRDTAGCKLPGCRGERDFSSRPCKLTAY